MQVCDYRARKKLTPGTCMVVHTYQIVTCEPVSRRKSIFVVYAQAGSVMLQWCTGIYGIMSLLDGFTLLPAHRQCVPQSSL